MKLQTLVEMVDTQGNESDFGMDVAAEFFKLGESVRRAFARPMQLIGNEFGKDSDVYKLYAAAYAILPSIVKDLKDDNPNHVHITHVIEIVQKYLSKPEHMDKILKNTVASGYDQEKHGDFDERSSNLDDIFSAYGEAAKSITPYNPLQQFCKDLCMELSKKNFENASVALTKVTSLFTDEASLKRAATIHHKNASGELSQLK